jgi:hypothetical protein
MPRYFFVIRWPDGQEHDDPDATSCMSDGVARKCAEGIVRVLKASGGYDDPGLTVVVQNAKRETLFIIPF